MKPVGQDYAWKQLLGLSGAIPQGLIFTGPPSVGKKQASYAWFQFLNCSQRTIDSGCGECPSCRKIANLQHADLIEIKPGSSQIISVDDLREMKRLLYYSPLEGGKLRFVIIDDAHKLNAASANSILKVLEEPPSHTRFIFITPQRHSLTATIVSRCQFVRFRPLENGLENLPDTHVDFQKSIEQFFGKDENFAIQLADQVSTEDWKLDFFIDFVFKHFYDQMRKTPSQKLANLSLETAYLKRRFARFANKKLIALKTAQHFLAGSTL